MADRVGILKGALFVSMGADCQPAYHVRRLTLNQNLRFFDWIGSPARSVKLLIESRFADVFHPDFTEWQVGETKPVLYDRRYELWFDHYNGEADETTAVAVWRQFTGLGRQFMRIMEEDSPICFVKRLHYSDGPDGVTQAKDLAEMILAMRPNSVFLALREKPDRQPEIHGRYIDAFNWDVFEDWIGSPDLYDDNFIAAYKILEGLTGKLV